ncbi:MAG: MmgE/PrpD family protein [Hyphomicrobiales bacterium]|nr:MmgE/PrpD family protein [Hyphomicrobiales bacterium]MCP5370597.1 MmgE/PrpD family protein [Hyphomicrobiales bacterium]
MDSSPSDPDPNRRLARFAAADSLDALPAGSRIAAVRQIADTVAVGWAGSAEDGAVQAADLARAEGGDARVPLWGSADRVTVAQATFANGVAAAALDYDCVHRDSLLHPAAVTVPLALALAAETGADGRKTVDSHIIGCEVMCRVSAATPRQSNWFPASIYAVFGAAATAARLLDLDPERTRHALGLALAQAAGTKQAIAERSLAKRFQTAFAARAGLLAARLAAAGVTAAGHFLDGPGGLFALYESGDPARVVDGLGESFTFQDTTIKKYPACLCTHVVIEGVRALRDRYQIGENDITTMEAIITPYMNRLIGGAYDPGQDPQVAAQFSAAYTAACALRYGGFRLAHIEPAAAADPAMAALARSVAVGVFDDRDGHLAPARVAVTLRDGSRREILLDEVPNAATGPDAEAAVAEKVLDCLTRGRAPLSEPAARVLLGRLLDLDRAPDVHGLFDGLPH